MGRVHRVLPEGGVQSAPFADKHLRPGVVQKPLVLPGVDQTVDNPGGDALRPRQGGEQVGVGLAFTAPAVERIERGEGIDQHLLNIPVHPSVDFQRRPPGVLLLADDHARLPADEPVSRLNLRRLLQQGGVGHRGHRDDLGAGLERRLPPDFHRGTELPARAFRFQAQNLLPLVLRQGIRPGQGSDSEPHPLHFCRVRNGTVRRDQAQGDEIGHRNRLVPEVLGNRFRLLPGLEPLQGAFLNHRSPGRHPQSAFHPGVFLFDDKRANVPPLLQDRFAPQDFIMHGNDHLERFDEQADGAFLPNGQPPVEHVEPDGGRGHDVRRVRHRLGFLVTGGGDLVFQAAVPEFSQDPLPIAHDFLQEGEFLQVQLTVEPGFLGDDGGLLRPSRFQTKEHARVHHHLIALEVDPGVGEAEFPSLEISARPLVAFLQGQVGRPAGSAESQPQKGCQEKNRRTLLHGNPGFGISSSGGLQVLKNQAPRVAHCNFKRCAHVSRVSGRMKRLQGAPGATNSLVPIFFGV